MVSGSRFDWKNESAIVGAFLIYFDVVMIFFKFVRVFTRELFDRY